MLYKTGIKACSFVIAQVDLSFNSVQCEVYNIDIFNYFIIIDASVLTCLCVNCMWQLPINDDDDDEALNQ